MNSWVFSFLQRALCKPESSQPTPIETNLDDIISRISAALRRQSPRDGKIRINLESALSRADSWAVQEAFPEWVVDYCDGPFCGRRHLIVRQWEYWDDCVDCI